MKATGTIRRVDDLGRVVIPKEIRRTFDIKEGDPLEVFITEEGIYFVPYRTEISQILNAALGQIDAIDCKEGERVREIFKENNLI
jgi:AbrB family looped-hinge helix DNA binding protein